MVERAKLTIDHSSGWATRVIHPRAVFQKKKKKTPVDAAFGRRMGPPGHAPPGGHFSY